MIQRTPKGYKVVSHSGKNLSGNDLSFREAKQRIREVEYFKKHKRPRYA